MQRHRWFTSGVLHLVAAAALVLAGVALLAATAEAQPTVVSHKSTKATTQLAESDFTTTQERLIALLRTSPTLTSVVARDPSLLSDQDYVRRNNPELAQFLDEHPEIVRNPDYYLFSGMDRRGRRPEQFLERKVWPEIATSREDSPATVFMHDLGPTLAFLIFVAALLWLIRIFVENRRWGRVFRMQTEVHGRLIDKFGSNEELLTYMGTEAGKRFLEAAPISVELEQSQRIPGVVNKVLLPLQIGIVLILLGAGLLFLRSNLPHLSAPLLVFGIVAFMPGLGFVLSAGITWVLASRLGMMPGRDSAPASERQL